MIRAGMARLCTTLRSATRAALAVLVVGGILAGPAAAKPHEQPTPGAAGLGDRLFPTLGNGGYDTEHYALDLTYPTGGPSDSVQGEVTIRAEATQSLSRFNLDFDGDSVGAVTVDGRPATWQLQGEELVITPARTLRNGRDFVVRVDFVSHPKDPPPDDPSTPDLPEDLLPLGWFNTFDGSVVGAQPEFAHEIYPSNDHPSDKASYSFKLDVPNGVTAVANGILVGRSTRGRRTTWRYWQRQPMASELVQLAVGQLDVIGRGRSRGVPLRDVVADTVSGDPDVEAVLELTPRQMDWMVDRVGPYPFDLYGVLVADQIFVYALETQTLSLHPALLFDPEILPPEVADQILLHELAHQWYGDSVAPATWSDLWLNEGHATWYENTYAAEFHGLDFEAFIRDAYANGDQWRADFGPVALPSHSDFDLFSPNVYEGGATVLYALRQVIGDETFRKLERRWAQRFKGESVSTDDFIAFASRVAHRDLGPFLRDWVYGTKTPPMPGHPDWTVNPVESGIAAQSRSSARAPEFPRSSGVLLKR
jgi:aminopeptidase N